MTDPTVRAGESELHPGVWAIVKAQGAVRVKVIARDPLDGRWVTRYVGGEYAGFDDGELELDKLPTPHPVLSPLREKVLANPRRSEFLGGQQTSYIQLDDVIALIDNAITEWKQDHKPSFVERVEALAKKIDPVGWDPRRCFDIPAKMMSEWAAELRALEPDAPPAAGQSDWSTAKSAFACCVLCSN